VAKFVTRAYNAEIIDVGRYDLNLKTLVVLINFTFFLGRI